MRWINERINQFSVGESTQTVCKDEPVAYDYNLGLTDSCTISRNNKISAKTVDRIQEDIASESLRFTPLLVDEMEQ